MNIGGNYNWKHSPQDQLIYIGKKGAWHQFRKIGDPRDVWCEVLDEDLHMIEEQNGSTNTVPDELHKTTTKNGEKMKYSLKIAQKALVMQAIDALKFADNYIEIEPHEHTNSDQADAHKELRECIENLKEMMAYIDGSDDSGVIDIDRSEK